MAKMYQKMPFLKILLFLWHFCRFLWLGCLYWILVFSFHLFRQIHNFWYPYWLYLWEKNISWTKGGPFDFSRHKNAWATAQTAWNELKFFLGGPRTLNNGKNFRAHFFSTNVEKWLALTIIHSPSQEPAVSFTAPNQYLKDKDVLCIFKSR